MNRGIILSLDNTSAIMFTSDCRLVRVPSRKAISLGQEIIVDSPKESYRSGSRVMRPVLAFAAAVFAIIAGFIITQSILNARTYAVLSVDVNPSLQFSINKDFMVTNVEALNADASRLLIKENYKGLTWQEAVDRWLLCLEQNGYEEIGDVLISAVMPEKDTLLKSQLMLLKETSGNGEGSGIRLHIIYSHDGSVAETARKNGLSVGMQMIVNRSAAQQGPWNAENVKATSLGELVRILAQSGEMDQTRITVNPPSHTGKDETDPGSPTRPSTPADTRPSADPTKPSTPADTRPSADPTKPTKPTKPTQPSESTERTIPSNSNATKPKPTKEPQNP